MASTPGDETPTTPNTEAGTDGRVTDSRVQDWFGQSAERDAELADEVAAELGEGAEAEREFEARAAGREEQDARHGDSIDPDQGRSAYTDEP